MSYGRDRDIATRGVGAVAARDKVNPGAAVARRARARAQLAKRERALAGLTYGVRGGVQHSLGAISRASAGMTGATSVSRLPTIKTGGIIEGERLSGSRTTTILPPPPPPTQPLPWKPIPGAKTAISTLMPRAPKAEPVRVVDDGGFGRRPSTTTTTSTNSPATTLATSILTKPPGKGITAATSSSGGGGGGGGGGIVSGGSGPEVPALPEDVVVPDVGPGSASKITGKHLAIAGAIGLGAYLLLKKKKKKGSS